VSEELEQTPQQSAPQQPETPAATAAL